VSYFAKLQEAAGAGGARIACVLHDLSPRESRTPTAAAVTLADAEREHILGVLRETAWALGSPKGVATRLGMKRSTLHWKMKRLGISRPEKCPPVDACARRRAPGRWHFPSLRHTILTPKIAEGNRLTLFGLVTPSRRK
jgi:hypothetical protein